MENGFGGNNSMNSFNHYSFGAVGQWMIAHSLGIQRETPGFKTFLLRPEPDPTGGMTSAEGHYDSMYGRIESGWRVDGATVTYRIMVPANTTATLMLPTSNPASVTEGGKPATSVTGVTCSDPRMAVRCIAWLQAPTCSRHRVSRMGSDGEHGSRRPLQARRLAAVEFARRELPAALGVESDNHAAIGGAMLEALHLWKFYGGTAAVRDVSFVVGAGEIVGYLGANGSGKSTTARMVTGLLTPSRGVVAFKGRDIAEDLVAYRQRLGYVPEEPALYGYLSGREYLEFVAQLRALPDVGRHREGAGPAPAVRHRRRGRTGHQRLLQGHEAEGAC